MDEQPNAEERGVDPNVPENRGDEQVDPQATGADIPENRGDASEAEGTATPSQEDLQQLNKENQQRYQRILELAKTGAPEVYEEFRQEYPKRGQVEQPVIPVVAEEPEEPEYDSDYVTPGQLKKHGDQLVDRIVSHLDGFQQKQVQDKAVGQAREDYSTANGELSSFLRDNGITQQQFDWARDSVAPMGIEVGTKEQPTPGGAAKYAYAVMTLLGPYVRTPEGDAAETARLARIEVDAADRGRQGLFSTHPSGAPGGIGTPSAEQQAADKIQPDTHYQASQ